MPIKIELSWAKYQLVIQLTGKVLRSFPRFLNRLQAKERHIWQTWRTIHLWSLMTRWSLTAIILLKFQTIRIFVRALEVRLAVTTTSDPHLWLTSRCQVKTVWIVWTILKCSNGTRETKWPTMGRPLMPKIRCSKNSYSKAPYQTRSTGN
jgi:hypothetical protein